MSVTLSTKAKERATYVVDITFRDEDGDDVIPTAITWTLTDGLANVVNSRLQVAVVVPAASISVVLSGLDLAIGPAYHDKFRKLLLEWTYNSSLGNGLPGKEEVTFEIEDFVKLTGTT